MYELNEKAAATLIKKTDKRRANYYNYFTGGKWGKAENYETGNTILPSGFFAVKEMRNEEGALTGVAFYGGGNGHGVGMSQYGKAENYDLILNTSRLDLDHVVEVIKAYVSYR